MFFLADFSNELCVETLWTNVVANIFTNGVYFLVKAFDPMVDLSMWPNADRSRVSASLDTFCMALLKNLVSHAEHWLLQVGVLVPKGTISCTQ